MADAKKAAKAYIDWSDGVVRSLDIPVMTQALELLDKVFFIADAVGVGDEVRSYVYTVRALEYGKAVAASVVPAAAAEGGAAMLTGIGGMAALGAVGIVIGVVSVLLGGDDDEERQKAIKRAQGQVLHLRERLTLHDFASEQDTAALEAHILAALPWEQHAARQKDEERAKRLALFYRRAEKELAPAERVTFESIANLARWQGALGAYQKLSWPARDGIDVMFGTSAPRLPYQLSAPIKAETAALAARLEPSYSIPGYLTMPSAGGARQRGPSVRARSGGAVRAQAARALAGVAGLALVVGGVYYFGKRGI